MQRLERQHLLSQSWKNDNYMGNNIGRIIFLIVHQKLCRLFGAPIIFSACSLNNIKNKIICTSAILNTHNSTSQYPFSILYLPTQIQMDIVYQKNSFKRKF